MRPEEVVGRHLPFALNVRLMFWNWSLVSLVVIGATAAAVAWIYWRTGSAEEALVVGLLVLIASSGAASAPGYVALGRSEEVLEWIAEGLPGEKYDEPLLIDACGKNKEILLQVDAILRKIRPMDEKVREIEERIGIVRAAGLDPNPLLREKEALEGEIEAARGRAQELVQEFKRSVIAEYQRMVAASYLKAGAVKAAAVV